MSPVVVVCAIMTMKAKVFVARRPRHKHHGGLWEFPGGKVEAGESLEAAIDRELMEELAIQVEGHRVLSSVLTEGGIGPIRLVPILCRPLSDKYVLKEHMEGAWLSLDELGSLKLCEGDRDILDTHFKAIEGQTLVKGWP